MRLFMFHCARLRTGLLCYLHVACHGTVIEVWMLKRPTLALSASYSGYQVFAVEYQSVGLVCRHDLLRLGI